jgi:hypothetical protein
MGAPAAAVAVSAPPADVAYFYNDLASYGTWVDLPGAGWCWQPTVCTTVVGWQPYLYAGHWLNTDAGWFWASDYSWGWAPFHYGRWQLHPTAGWVWFPGRVWGPSWVIWRSGGDHCGWAPLPPHADFVAGVGWSYNGVHVGATFDFGLAVGCFSFVSCAHFGDYNLHTYCVPHTQVTQIYKSTTIINNVTYVNNTYVNRGVNVNVFERAGGRKFETVKISESAHGGTGTAVAYRHPLPFPAPVHAMTATKMDTHGRIPVNLSANPKIANTSVVGSGNRTVTGTTGSQKGTGSTHNFSTEAADGKNRTGNTQATGVTHDFSADKADAKAHSASGQPANSKVTTTTGSTATSGNKVSTAGNSTSMGQNPKAYNYQGTPPKGQTEYNAQNRQVHPGDVRGADALTTRENSYNNQNAQHSGNPSAGGSKGSSSSGSNKDNNSGGSGR